MKKLLGILAISALAASAFAQGTISIQNTATELIQQWTAEGNSTLMSVPAGQGHVQFFAAPAGSSLTPLGSLGALGFSTSYTTLAGFLAANSSWNAYAINTTVAAGRIVGNTVTVTPLTPGASIDYITIGWTGAFTTLDQAIAGGAMIGESPMLVSTTGNPTVTPAVTPSLMNATYTGIVLAPQVVPEPTSFALAGLGLAALVAFRRRS